MKSILLYASFAALSVASAFAACTPNEDKTDNTGGTGNPGAGGEQNSSTGGKTTTGPGAGGDATNNGGEPTGAAGEPMTSAGGQGAFGSTPITSCGTGVLLEGDPLWTDYLDGVKPAGQGLFDDPPIRNEAIAVIGNMLFVETEFEIWSADLSQKTPKISRFAGLETNGDTFVDAGKACKDTRFLVMRDMIAKPNGKLAVVDYVGGAIIEITDPAGPNCKSDWVAGTHVKTPDPANDYPLAQGDMDGPGATALFGDVGGGGGIHHITTDPDGNLYTFDDGTGKFKMIANESDPQRTVTTIGQGAADDNVIGLAFLKGKLYATGVDGSNDFLIEVDPAKYNKAKPKDNVVDVFRQPDHFADVEAGHQAVTSQVISDGEALIISGDSGYVWRVAADGTVLATLAGTGVHLEYDPVGQDPFDPTIPHPASQWWLRFEVSNSDGGPWLALSNSKLYWSGGMGTGKHIVQFSCK
jgi:hypothetical protein